MGEIAYNRRVDGVEPSRQLMWHIMGVAEDPDDRLTLEELFVEGRDPDDTTLSHLRDVARLKVIGVLRLSEPGYRSHATGRLRGTRLEYTVSRSTDEIYLLVSYIADNMKGSRDFVRVADLPEPYRLLTKHWRNTVRAHARRMLLTDVVSELVGDGTQLWYHPGHSRWQASQSLIDAYEPLLARVRGWSPPRRSLKLDQRAYHGRPKRDRRRNRQLGIAPGVSTGKSQPFGRR